MQSRIRGLHWRFGILELAFDTKELRTICENEDYAKQVLKPLVAEILKHRLADLRAATSIRDLVAGRVHQVEDINNHHMIVGLRDNHRIVLCANHPKNPTDKDGRIDWSRVSRIKVLGIGREHA